MADSLLDSNSTRLPSQYFPILDFFTSIKNSFGVYFEEIPAQKTCFVLNQNDSKRYVQKLQVKKVRKKSSVKNPPTCKINITAFYDTDIFILVYA